MSSSIQLSNVYKTKERALTVLYDLLKERDTTINISHRKMPTWRSHHTFFNSKPYRAWYLILGGAKEAVGSIYLSKSGEIGIFIFKIHQAKGYGQQAVKMLMSKHAKTGRFLANVNPLNHRSVQFFKRMQFRLIQNTYELRRSK